MSQTLPEGSKVIRQIDFSKLKYLVDGNVVDSPTEENFDILTGKPKTNITLTDKIDDFFLTNISANFHENSNINDSLIYQYPKLLEVDSLRDMQVTDETTIDAVFIFEGASMKNLFGYYMYTVDVDGNKQLLDNADDSKGNYYSPTVIFPHVYSDSKVTNSLQRGEMRRLIGNLPNGNFSNIYIGLFLVPHGWFAIEEKSPIYNENILYSTLEFNVNYTPSDYVTVTDKIYSVYFKALSEKGDELLLTAFEDIFVDGVYDLDYNDCVVGFNISNVGNIVDFNNYSKVEVNDFINTVAEKKNNIMGYDDNGEYVELNRDIYNIDPTKNHVLERHKCFNNREDQENCYNVYKRLNTNYVFSVTKNNDFGQNEVIISHRFRTNDLKAAFGTISSGNSNNGKENDNEHGNSNSNPVYGKIAKIYLCDNRYNKENEKSESIEDYKLICSKSLEDDSYSEKYRLYNEATKVDVIRLDNIIDKPQKMNVTKFRIIGNGVMDCKYGKSHLPFTEKAIYRAYKNSSTTRGLSINIGMDDHPTDYMRGKKTFVRRVSFNVDSKELVVIDLADLSIYTEVSGVLVAKDKSFFKSITISDIVRTDGNIKDLIGIFRTDSEASYRIITLSNGMVFYCIRLPAVKNNPTMVFMKDSNVLPWTDNLFYSSGTYYNKERTYRMEKYAD